MLSPSKFTVITAAMNFLCIVNETMHGRGFPIASALAFAFGVYIAIFQWKLLQAHRMLLDGIASHAPSGARPIDSPRNRWQSHVKRLV